ncbi:MAG: hypothetical protein IKC65_09065 [Lentisphaeria bacterium]|nr:hypothetical protein [Lentisphaeria bacterium]
MKNIILSGNSGELHLDLRGRITALLRRNTNTAAAAETAFMLGLRDENRDPVIVDDSFFTECSVTADETRAVFVYSGYNALEVELKVESTTEGFAFYLNVTGIPEQLPLEWVDYPCVCVPKTGFLLWPRCEGILIDSSDRREGYGPWHVAGFVDTFPGGFYPGHCQMQFLCHYDESGEGLYFEADDRSHTLKNVDFAPAGTDKRRLSLQTFCGGRVTGGTYRSPFACLVRGFSGDWQDACGIYRERIADDPVLPAKFQYPSVVKNSPVVVIYPVQGEGKDCGQMTVNEYFPYDNALPVLEKLSKRLESKVMSLLMHWEGTAPWAPPYVWPPLGGSDMLTGFAEKLHEKGHYLGLYCSGTAWTQKSQINSYSCEKQFEEEGLISEMIRGPHGEIKAVSCTAPGCQRFGYDMCMARQWCRDTVKAEIARIQKSGVDYIQFFDQNIGGRFLPCYSREHGHPEHPGVWQTEAMKRLYSESVAETGALLGAEAAGALPFIKELPFSDLRNNFSWPYGEPVPAYEFVFHEYLVNFSGNQCGLTYHLDLEGTPVNMLYRIAYGFAAGNLLSVVLKEKGKIHWGWSIPWDYPEPDQESALTLTANLNKARQTYPEYLLYGRMEKLSVDFSCGTDVIARKNGEKISIPEILAVQWCSPEGKRAVVLTNYHTKPVSCRMDGREITLAPLDAAVIKLG